MDPAEDPYPCGRPGTAQQLLHRHHRLWLAAILLLALLVRVALLSDLQQTIYAHALSPDEDTYHRWAAGIARGTDASDFAPDFAPDFARLPAVVFAAVYSALGVDSLYLRHLNLALGLAICALAYGLGRALYGKPAGLGAALVCATSESLAFYSVTLLHTCLGVLAVGLLLGVGVACAKAAPKWLPLLALAAGALLGVVINVRGNAVSLALLVVPVLFVMTRRAYGLRRAGLALVLTAASYVLSATACGELGGPRSAFNFYIGNAPDNASPYFRPVRFTSSAPEHQAFGFTVEASRRQDKPLSMDEAERYWVRVVFDGALEEPVAFAKRLGWKALALVHASPSDNNHDLRFFRALLPSLGGPWLVPSWLLLALCAACATALPRDARLVAGAAAIALYGLSVVAFFAGERLRAPLLLLASPYAAAGAARLCVAARERRWAPLTRAGVVFALFVATSRAPVPYADDLSPAFNMHALILLSDGQLDAAERWYRRSLAHGGQASEGARIGLAAILQKRGELDAAVAILEPLDDAHYEAASKHEWLGNLALARRRPADATRAFETAIELDASRQNAYKGLFIALRMLGRDDDARAIDARLEHVRSLISVRGEPSARLRRPRPRSRAWRHRPRRGWSRTRPQRRSA